MARVLKTLLRPGIYQAPQGILEASRARLAAWTERFRAMKQAGIRIPVSWGHQPEAEPGDPLERQKKQYWLSAFNAGYVEDMDLDPASGDLRVNLDCPGLELDGDNLTAWVELPDGRRVRSAIGEVSAAIRDWRDGSGRDWPDSIIHVALTPLPVAHGTGGFAPVPARGVYLSLASYLSAAHSESDEVANMAEDKDKPDKDKPDAAESSEKGGGKDHFAEGMEILRTHGINLPEDTSAENFWERLCVAGAVLEGAKADAATTDAAATDAVTPEPEPAVDPDEGVSYSGEDEDEEDKEEPRPVMMSLATAKTPVERQLIQREQDRHRERQLQRLAGLVKRGLKPARAAALREQLTGYTLSLTADGQLVPQQVDVLLSALDESLPARHPLAGKRTEVTRRDLREQVESPDEIKRRAEEVSVRK